MSAPSAIDALLARPPYDADPGRGARFAQAMAESFRHHLAACEPFRRYCNHHGVPTPPDALDRYPYLPVRLFKTGQLRSVAEAVATRTLRSSGTTGTPSQVAIDDVTARRQTRASASVLASHLGSQRRPFVMVDVAPSAEGDLTARAAATRGLLAFASSVDYVLRDDGHGLALDPTLLDAALARVRDAAEPACVFGFTYLLHGLVLAPLARAGRRIELPHGSHLVHLGGWKRLEAERVSRNDFLATAHAAFGLGADDVVDVYGFTEQMGLVYPSAGPHPKVTPAYAELIVRNPGTLAPVPDGERGLLQFLTPLPHSYPGISVLTEDVGRIVGRGADAHGRIGTWFEVLGRASQAESRGCGDLARIAGS